MRTGSLLAIVVFAFGCSSKSRGSGGASSGSGSSGGGSVTQQCNMPGATRACCGSGTQTCAGIEFPT